MTPDRVVVLNLARRPDRLAEFRAGLPADWPWPDPQTVTATDGEDLAVPVGWRANTGAYGCRQTHLKVLAAAIADGVDALLVLEDDAEFVPDFTSRAGAFATELPDDWGMVMLGGQHIRPGRVIGLFAVACVDTERTHAYLVRRAAIPVVLKAFATAHDHLDHQLPVVQRTVPTYAPAPFLVGQRAGWSDIEHRDEPARSWRTG